MTMHKINGQLALNAEHVTHAELLPQNDDDGGNKDNVKLRIHFVSGYSVDLEGHAIAPAIVELGLANQSPLDDSWTDLGGLKIE